MKFQHGLYGIIIISLIIGCSSPRPMIENGAWSEIIAVDDSKPVERHEAAFIGIGHKMYLLGGRGMKPVSIYDQKANSWTQGAVPPIELHHFQPIVYHNEIYVVGAMTGNYPGETPVPHMYIYSPEKNTWRKGPAIPKDRNRGGTGVIIDGSQLYLVCGIKDGHRGDHKKWLDRYNFNSGKWEILADAPRARDHFQATLINDKIYAIAGRTTIAADSPFKNTIGEVDVYDISNNTWTTLDKNIPTQRAGNFNTVINNEILVLGGESFEQEKAHSEVELLNVENNTWRSGTLMPIGRHGTGVVLTNGHKIYVASGSGNHGGGPELSDLWVYEY